MKGLLAEPQFAHSNPFLRYSLARRIEDKEIEYAELARCLRRLPERNLDLRRRFYEHRKLDDSGLPLQHEEFLLEWSASKKTLSEESSILRLSSSSDLQLRSESHNSSGTADLNTNRRPVTWADGRPLSDADLHQEVYGELHRVARTYMSHQNARHSLQATALVNEAYLRIRNRGVIWNDREHFFRMVSTIMRRTLIDHARRRDTEKRTGTSKRVEAGELDEMVHLFEEKSGNLLRLDAALLALEKQDSELAQIIELRFFGGRSVEEISQLLKISERSLARRIDLARRFLSKEMNQ